MSLSRDLSLLHRTMQSYAKNQCRFRGATLPCTATTEWRGTILTSGGKELEIQLTLFILKEDLIAAFFSQTYNTPTSTGAEDSVQTADADTPLSDDATTMPKTGEKIWYKERAYKIGQVRTESADTVYRLELEDVNR